MDKITEEEAITLVTHLQYRVIILENKLEQNHKRIRKLQEEMLK